MSAYRNRNTVQICVVIGTIVLAIILSSFFLYRLIGLIGSKSSDATQSNKAPVIVKYLKEGENCTFPNAICHPDLECDGVCKVSIKRLKPTCWHILQANRNSPDGVYNINIHGNVVPVYCEMQSGGWTRIFNKINRAADFNKSWSFFRDGFGSLTGNYWLGLHYMHLLTRSQNLTLRMELYNTENDVNSIEYNQFKVNSESENFTLILGKLKSGNLLDHSDYHYGMAFSTFDRDNDPASSNCASSLQGGWWFNSCFYFCFTCEGTGIAGHYRFIYSSYRFFKFIKMLVRPIG